VDQHGDDLQADEYDEDLNVSCHSFGNLNYAKQIAIWVFQDYEISAPTAAP
jgi:hypothetical protein